MLNGSSPASPPVISAQKLTKQFDGVSVVEDLDLEIRDGMIVGLIGPSGCGKTTTVRMLAGLLSPSSGNAEIYGRPSNHLSASERSIIGYMPQTPALFPDLSVWENLSFHASMYGLPFRRRKHLRGLLEWVELGDDRRKRVSATSGGMKRRLALAAAFVHDPTCVFLDEPTAGIDPILRDKFWRRFRELGNAGRTLLITTQYVGEAANCDLVGLLSDGHLLLLDTPDNLRRAAFGGRVVDVTFASPVSDEQMADVARLPIVVGPAERRAHHTLRLVVDEAEGDLADLRGHLNGAGLDVKQADEYMADYDEAFVRVVERHRQTGESAAASADTKPDGALVHAGA